MSQLSQEFILSIKAAADPTFTPVGCMQSKNLNRSRDVVDLSCDDTPNDRKVAPTQRSWSIAGAAIYVFDDAGQLKLEEAFASNAAYDVKLSDGVSGRPEFTGQGFVTDMSLGGQTNQVVTTNVTIEGDGPLTRANVP